MIVIPVAFIALVHVGEHSLATDTLELPGGKMMFFNEACPAVKTSHTQRQNTDNNGAQGGSVCKFETRRINYSSKSLWVVVMDLKQQVRAP
jgi:hypothetical protein